MSRSDDTAPPRAQALSERAGAPSGSDIRVPPRALSAAKQGEGGAPERVGSPAGAEEVHSLPAHQMQKTIEIEESPTRGNRAGDSLYYLALDSVQRLTLSLGDALLRDRVRRAEFLGEEAHTQLLKHPVHASERIGNKSPLRQRLDSRIVGIL